MAAISALQHLAYRSVRKVVLRSKFTEQIFMPRAEQNFQLCAQIIYLNFASGGTIHVTPTNF